MREIWEDQLVRILDLYMIPPWAIVYVDILHESGCPKPEGEPCDCEPVIEIDDLGLFSRS